MKKQRNIKKILRILHQTYPDAACSLQFSNPLQLLVATILSAQCTDQRVNKVTALLFQKYRHAEDFSKVPLGELENDIRSTGFFRNKAKNIQNACRTIIKTFQGKVPSTMEDLITLPGVARKTANVVLGTIYGLSVGIVVDTHVFRISHRLGLSKTKTPEKTEAELMSLIPRERWISFSHELISHGRAVCDARKPLCQKCPLEKICPKAGLEQ